MISIIVPIYNEVKSIRKLCDSLLTVQHLFLGTDSEIILVDDGSTDGTAEEILDFTQQKKSLINFKVLRNVRNSGYGAAIKKGVHSSRYENCAILDCDLTYDPKCIHELWQLMKQMELDMIVGQRVGKIYEGTPIKKFLRTCLRFFVEFMSDRKIPDINSGLRIFKKEIVLNNPRLLSDRFSFTTSLTLTSLLSGRQVGYIPVPYQKREGKSKVKLLKDSIRTFGLILSVAFYFNPLKVAFPLLIFGTLLSFVGAMAVFFGLEFFIALYILISYLILTLVLLLGLLSHLVSLKN